MAKREEWEIVKIGADEYSFEMLPPEYAFTLSIKVVEALGGIMASIIPMLGVDSEKLDIFNIDWSSLNIAEVQASMLSAVKHVDHTKLAPLVQALVPMTFIVKENRRATWDDFNGKMMTLYKVMYFNLRYQFADFFEGKVEG